MSQLYDACFASDWNQVDRLLNTNSNVNYRHPKNEMSTLYVAVARRAPLSIVKRIVAGGASPNDADIKGFTPLHAGCEYHAAPDVVRFLLSAGGDPNQRAFDGATAMHIAAQFAVDCEVMSVLLQAGGQLNLKKKNGVTPLLAAVENSASPALVRMLLEAGADDQATVPNIRNGSLETALDVAKRRGLQEHMALLADWKGNRSPLASFATVSPSKVEVARLLFQHAVTSSSTWKVTQAQNAKTDDEHFLRVNVGDNVVLVHGTPETGLFSPYENYVLVSTLDGRTGMVPCKALKDDGYD